MTAAYQQTAEEAVRAMGSDAPRALERRCTHAPVAFRSERACGRASRARVPAWRKFVAQFADVLVILRHGQTMEKLLRRRTQITA